MNRSIHVISTCSLTKRHAPPASNRIGNYSAQGWNDVVEAWLYALQVGDQPRYEVPHLYQGSHWKETKACITAAESSGFEVTPWVLSAGWGLLSFDDSVASYSSTFSPSSDDSIHGLEWPPETSAKDRARAWWTAINEGLSGKSMSQRLLGTDSSITSAPLIVVIVSKDYYQAIEHELLEMSGCNCDLVIVSASLHGEPGSFHPSLRRNILPFSDKFKQASAYLNKDNVSLNARLATWLFHEYPRFPAERTEALFDTITEIESRLPELPRKAVVKMTDDEVLAFIGAYYQPHSTATRLLRQLRDVEAKSCEQARFRKLFDQYKETHGDKGGLFDG